jgi:hypothetical protein
MFQKAMVYEPAPGKAGILTLGGNMATIKLWGKGAASEVVWQEDFGGKVSLMRDGEVADVYGDGSSAIAVATHDQGVVALVRPGEDGGYHVEELDRQADTIVHEVEIGDLDGDGQLKCTLRPASPTVSMELLSLGKSSATFLQKGEGRTVVADLGDRHAKEILVDDVDGDGTDELYVSVEAVTGGGQVEVLRFDADTDPTQGVMIAELSDKLCRFLIYVASDDHKEVRRYVWEGGKPGGK